MRDGLRLILGVLAVYRATNLLVREDGPGDVFLRLRTALGRYDYVPDGDELVPATKMGRFIACPYCVGMWLALLWALVARPRSVRDWLTWALAVAGGQRAMDRLLDSED